MCMCIIIAVNTGGITWLCKCCFDKCTKNKSTENKNEDDQEEPLAASNGARQEQVINIIL